MDKLLDRISAKGAAEAEVFEMTKIKKDINFENNKLKSVKTSQNSGIALRTVVDGKMGFTASTNIDDMDRVIDNAISVSRVSENKEFSFGGKSGHKTIKLENDRIWDIPEEQLIEDGIWASGELNKFDSDLLTNISFQKEKVKIKISNTSGINDSYEKDTFGISLMSNMVKGTNFIYCVEESNSVSEKYDIKEMVEKVKERLSILKVTADFEPGNKSVIFTPDSVRMIFLTLCQGLSGVMVDKGVSPLCGRLGEKIFDDKITIVDDGTLEGEAGSFPFDDEGTPSKRTVLFEKGILKSYLHSLRTAAKLNQEPTGNGLKHIGLMPAKALDALPKPNITNWIMEPGNIPYENMVKDIRDGVIIDNIMGIFMNNLLNGDFSGNIGIGYVVRNGKIVGRIKDAAINANIYNLFYNNIVGLSNRLYDVDSHKLPYIMLKDVFIAGKK